MNDLVDAGLAEYVANPDHKTSPLAQLTPEGERVLESINVAAEAPHQAILQQFSDTQVRQLRKLLRSFCDAARAHHPTPEGHEYTAARGRIRASAEAPDASPCTDGSRARSPAR